MRHVSGLEAIYRDYSAKNVKFFFIYKALAHPGIGNYVQPFTMEERYSHVRQAIQQLGSTIPWLVDPMDNRMKHALGDRPHSEYIIDPEGKIVGKLARSNPARVREILEQEVGKVEKITDPEELNLKVGSILPEPAAKGVVTRVPRQGMFALVTQPHFEKKGSPFYAKLRAEGDLNLIDQGKGKLYLGFHLDPFYQAHWNNLTDPLRFQLEAPEGVRLSQNVGEAPTLAVASDIDPREFVVDVEAWPLDKGIRMTVTYAACTEKECHNVRQIYVLRRVYDRDAGKAPGTGFRGFTVEAMVDHIRVQDKNGDGRIGEVELNSLLRLRHMEFDVNKDGVLDADEINRMAKQLVHPFGENAE